MTSSPQRSPHFFVVIPEGNLRFALARAGLHLYGKCSKNLSRNPCGALCFERAWLQPCRKQPKFVRALALEGTRVEYALAVHG